MLIAVIIYVIIKYKLNALKVMLAVLMGVVFIFGVSIYTNSLEDMVFKSKIR